MSTSPEALTRDNGLRLLKAGQVDEAVAALESALQAAPQDPQIHAFLGVAYNVKGDRERAVSAFEQSLALLETPKAHYNLGLAYESVQRTDDAAAHYRSALDLDPGYAPAVEALKKFATAPPSATTVMDAQPDFNAIFSQPTAPLDLSREEYEREQRFAEQRRSYIKSGLIYGIICGAGFRLLVRLAATVWVLPGAMILGAGGSIALEYLLVLIEGSIVGGLIGLWIGITCGGDTEGMMAGAVIGFVRGLIVGLIAGAGWFAFVPAIVFAITMGMFGAVIGRLVEASIGWN